MRLKLTSELDVVIACVAGGFKGWGWGAAQLRRINVVRTAHTRTHREMCTCIPRNVILYLAGGCAPRPLLQLDWHLAASWPTPTPHRIFRTQQSKIWKSVYEMHCPETNIWNGMQKLLNNSMTDNVQFWSARLSLLANCLAIVIWLISINTLPFYALF